jgi:rhodanese-related sulfurtransferase
MKATYYLSENGKKVIASVLVFMLLLVFGVGLPSLVNARPVTGTDITVQQAKKMIKHTSPLRLVILDVRNQSEFDLGHLYDATLIPLFMLENRTIELQNHINDKIIVYCSAGSRSTQACQLLIEKGFTKVYNIIGGINAWMEADYPIYTSHHHITVDFANHGKKTLIDIEPLLLYAEDSCTSCQNQTCSNDTTTPENVEAAVLEQNEQSLLISITFEANGTSFEMTINKTRLWSYAELEGDCNRTASLDSTEMILSSEVLSEDFVTKSSTLIYIVRSEEYKMALRTELRYQNLDGYESAVTAMGYVPTTDASKVLSMESVQFNSPVRLSKQYAVLSDVAKNLQRFIKRVKMRLYHSSLQGIMQ